MQDALIGYVAGDSRTVSVGPSSESRIYRHCRALDRGFLEVDGGLGSGHTAVNSALGAIQPVRCTPDPELRSARPQAKARESPISRTL